MRRAVVLVACGVLVTGCSSGGLTPSQRLQDRTAALVAQANAKDLAGLRAATADLIDEVDQQQRSGELSGRRAALLQSLLAAVEKDAPLVQATPTPSPSATPSATPTPSPSATPSATPSPTPSPTPSATPSPTPSPTPSSVLPTLGVGSRSPSPTPT